MIVEITRSVPSSKVLAPNSNHHAVLAVSFSWKAVS